MTTISQDVVQDAVDELTLVLDMLNCVNQGILVFDLDDSGREVLAASNPAAMECLEASSIDLIPGLSRVDLVAFLRDRRERDANASPQPRLSKAGQHEEMPFAMRMPSGRRVEFISRPRSGGGSMVLCVDTSAGQGDEADGGGLDAQYHAVLESAPAGVLRVLVDGSADYANPSALALFDVEFEELDVAARLLPSDGRALSWHIANSSRFEAEISTPYLTRHLMVSASAMVRSRGADMRILSLTDITPLKEARSRIEYLARHDALTGLGNRMKLKALWDALEPRLGINGCSAHLIALDLDHFKDVNDVYGHAVGDALLREVAKRLRLAVGPANHLFRFGGDEFLVLLDRSSRSETIEMAERIVHDLAKAFHISGHDLAIGCSAGIASAPLDGLSREQIHRAADLALYEVKRHGRNGIACYDPAHEQTMLERRLLQTDLALAIANEDFHLVFQRQVEIESEATRGLEVLLRWHNRRLDRLIPPSEFIPIAEQAGLVNLIDLWVIRNAIPELSRFIAAGWDRPHLAINLSPLTLGREDICRLLAETLGEFGVPGECLEIEITEGVVIAEIEKLRSILEELRQMGVKVAIDDFGAGQTSFGYLQSLPVERLKLDQSIVQRIGDLDGSAPIVAGIWDLCRRLGLKMTAEGVETAGQWAALKAIGPIDGQGFFLGLPESSELILRRLGVERKRPCG